MKSLKVFNLEEANALLPQLESFLRDLEAKYEAFRKKEDELFFEEILEGVSPEERELQGLEAALLRLEEEFEKIQGLGCRLRHAERGRVDFLAQQDSEWVYYCWQLGEAKIQFYHSLNGGFFERRPLAERGS